MSGSREGMKKGKTALRRAEENVNKSRPNDNLLRFELSKPEIIEKSLKVNDLMSENAPRHVINVIFRSIASRMPDLGMGNIRTIRDNPVVTAADNFDNLLFPDDNAGRSSTYTRYVDENHVLRTHTSAHVPKTFEKFYKKFKNSIPDTVFLFPGLVYRRDVIDPKHLDVFHQLDIWTLRENGDRGPVTRDDLLRLVDLIFEAVLPGKKPIIYEAKHPYTTDGIEVYAKFGNTELEVLEAGLAHPEVLRNAGFDPKKYSGLALGMGIDRIAMLLKELTDIRYLRSIDPRIAKQMQDIGKYKEVSNQPPISRDMSYCVPENYMEEDISEEIKEAFGDNAYLIEDVIIKSRTNYNDLPKIAIERLGAKKGQDNLLVRIVLRHPDKSLTREEANELYDNAYPILHKGDAGYFRQ